MCPSTRGIEKNFKGMEARYRIIQFQREGIFRYLLCTGVILGLPQWRLQHFERRANVCANTKVCLSFYGYEPDGEAVFHDFGYS